MDKKILVVAIAVGTVLITTLLQLWIRNREPSPAVKRLLWLTLFLGLIALLAVSAGLLAP